MIAPPSLRFTEAELAQAARDWGCNCGPTALAAVLGVTLDQVHQAIPGFDSKRYTSPPMMVQALRRLGATFERKVRIQGVSWPYYGLVRIQWAGPWTRPEEPLTARARHTHWVATLKRGPNDRGVFDVNASHWTPFQAWADTLVPPILKTCEPQASGEWWATDAIEITL